MTSNDINEIPISYDVKIASTFPWIVMYHPKDNELFLMKYVGDAFYEIYHPRIRQQFAAEENIKWEEIVEIGPF